MLNDILEKKEEKKEKKVEYLELIYDLIFVYIIGRNNSLLHHLDNGFVEPKMFIAYVLCTIAVIQIWNFTTYYINIYGRNGVRDHIFLFINMFLLYFVAEGTREHWQSYHTQYHAAWALILVNIGIQYLIELRNHKDEPEHTTRIKRIMCVIFGEAAIVAVSIPVYNATEFIWLTPAALLFGIGATFFAGRNKCEDLVDFAHLSERAMLYVVFTFGEMIIGIASYFEGNVTLNNLYFSGMAFLIVVGLFLSYGVVYDHIIDREKETNGLSYMFLHIFIIFALNNITTALEFMRNEEVNLTAKMAFLIGSFLIYYGFLFATGRYAKQRCPLRGKFYVKMSALGLSFVGLMFLLRGHMRLNIAVTVAYVFGIFLILHQNGKKMDRIEEKA